jgi:hypothetical protein
MDAMTRREAMKLTTAGLIAAAASPLSGAEPLTFSQAAGSGEDEYRILACDGGGVRGLLTALLKENFA